MNDKVSTQSADVVAGKLSELRRVLPGVFSEDKLDFEKLRAFFDDGDMLAGTPASAQGSGEAKEKYGLNWAGRGNAFAAIRAQATGTLAPCPDESVNFDETENVFIEGDNLEVLKLLQKHYREKIKMIYIDPPYNTGKDFVYKDNFSQSVADYYEQTGQTEGGIKMTANTEKNGRYHSDWLTMMYPRAFLAKNLLREDGVIFVSIDDNEVANLRLILDEIFGEENFVASITVVGNPRGRDYGGVAQMHDYILVYIKSEVSVIHNLNYPDKEFPFQDERGDFEIRELRNRNIAFNSDNRANLYYPFYVNPDKKDENGFFEISLEKHKGWFELYPKESQGYKTVWRWGKPKALENLNTEIAGKEMEDGGFQIVEKYRERTKMARSVWWDKEDNTEKGTLELKELFEGKKFFDFPKSSKMIGKLIEMGSDKDSNDIILDFFAGSGTTAHAVMDLNAEDGGNRKWICVQIPETTDEASEAYKAGYKNIAEISRERIRRAGSAVAKALADKGKIASSSAKATADKDTGFKAFALSKSNYTEWNVLTDKDDEETLLKQSKLFIEQPLVEGYDEKSVVYEILVKEGFDLNAKVTTTDDLWTITDNGKKIVVTFAEKVTQEQVKALELSETDTFVCFDNALDDTTKVNIMRNLQVRTI